MGCLSFTNKNQFPEVSVENEYHSGRAHFILS